MEIISLLKMPSPLVGYDGARDRTFVILQVIGFLDGEGGVVALVVFMTMQVPSCVGNGVGVCCACALVWHHWGDMLRAYADNVAISRQEGWLENSTCSYLKYTPKKASIVVSHHPSNYLMMSRFFAHGCIRSFFRSTLALIFPRCNLLPSLTSHFIHFIRIEMSISHTNLFDQDVTDTLSKFQPQSASMCLCQLRVTIFLRVCAFVSRACQVARCCANKNKTFLATLNAGL